MALDHLGQEQRGDAGRSHSAVFSPPTWAVLGPRPDDRHGRRVWLDAINFVEHYRAEHEVTDPAQPLGERPDEPAARDAYQQALRELLDARRRLRDMQQSEQAGPAVPARDSGVELA